MRSQAYRFPLLAVSAFVLSLSLGACTFTKDDPAETAQGALSAEEKMARLRELGSIDNIAQLDIHTPTLDEMYAQFLKREDV